MKLEKDKVYYDITHRGKVTIIHIGNGHIVYTVLTDVTKKRYRSSIELAKKDLIPLNVYTSPLYRTLNK